MSFFDVHEDRCDPGFSPCVRCRLSSYLITNYGVWGQQVVEGFLNGIGKPQKVATLGEHIGGLGLSTRTLRPLNLARIRTVRELIERGERELITLPHLGVNSIREIKVALANRGLYFGMDLQDSLENNSS